MGPEGRVWEGHEVRGAGRFCHPTTMCFVGQPPCVLAVNRHIYSGQSLRIYVVLSPHWYVVCSWSTATGLWLIAALSIFRPWCVKREVGVQDNRTRYNRDHSFS
jgi:hypothetical protein